MASLKLALTLITEPMPYVPFCTAVTLSGRGLMPSTTMALW